MDMASKQPELSQFIGTTCWHVYKPQSFPHVTLSDGAEYLANNFRCFWLMDAIATKTNFLAMSGSLYQLWTFCTKDGAGFLTCFDGQDHPLITIDIPHVNFPLDQIDLVAVYEEPFSLIMLPSEYNPG